MHGRPPFATRSPLRFKVSLYVYTSTLSTYLPPPSAFRARMCLLSLVLFSMLFYFSSSLSSGNVARFPSPFFVHRSPPSSVRSLLSQFSFSLFLSIYLFRSSLTSSCALSLSLSRFLAVFAYVCASTHVCAFKPRRGGRDGRIASVRTGVYRPLPDSRFFLRQRGREREREQLDGEKEKQEKGEGGEEKEKERERRQQGRGRKREAERTRGSKTEIDLRGSKCDRVTPK